VLCNDFFFWARSDAVDVTEETLPELEKAILDSDNIYGPLLYCARQREMRPQGAYYKTID
jgi:hypothetical protein